MPVSTVLLSGVITAMATSAVAAKVIMSGWADPMTIKEFTFKVNISSDFNINSATDLSLDIWRVSIKEKLTIDYKEHWGLEITCTIVPAFTLV